MRTLVLLLASVALAHAAPAAIPKQGQCPSGWMQPGAYCMTTGYDWNSIVKLIC